MFREVRILGQPVHVADCQRVLAHLKEGLARGERHFIVAQNPEKIVRALDDDGLARTIKDLATLTIADGIGVTLAARWLRLGKVPRVPGIDLFQALLVLADRRHASVFLYGGAPGVCERTARMVQRTHRNIVLTGAQHGYPADEDVVLEHIRAARPDFLFVGLGTPRQELWIGRHLERLPVACVMGVGGSFDVLAAKYRRAPAPMRRIGTEWLFRILQQPARARRVPALLRFAWLVGRARWSKAAASPDSAGRLAGRSGVSRQ